MVKKKMCSLVGKGLFYKTQFKVGVSKNSLKYSIAIYKNVSLDVEFKDLIGDSNKEQSSFLEIRLNIEEFKKLIA